jgi:membrane-associated protein
MNAVKIGFFEGILIMIVDFFSQLIHLITHLDQTLALWSQMLGPWLYIVLFLIIFAETGLVFAPFLPGDSLLFAVGALTALPEAGLNIYLMSCLLLAAALIGDNVNYTVGRFLGPQIFSKEDSKLFNKRYLSRAQEFYEKHGARAVVIGRFLPIFRTFVPFVAGVAKMNYRKYIGFGFGGGFLWINSFLFAGHFFGNLPQIKRNFHWVILAVILISLLPLAYEIFRHRKLRKA